MKLFTDDKGNLIDGWNCHSDNEAEQCPNPKIRRQSSEYTANDFHS